MKIVVHGTIQDGFDFIGPFSTGDDAQEYARDRWSDNWDIIELDPPTEVDD